MVGLWQTLKKDHMHRCLLLVIVTILISFLLGACPNDNSPTLDLTYYPAQIDGKLFIPIEEVAPRWSGNAGVGVTYSAEPALPTGLFLNPDTGIISGILETSIAANEYTITARLADGTVKQAEISLTIDSSGETLYYRGIVGVEDEEIDETSPSWNASGMAYRVDPALPEGLSLNPDTGTISGIPKGPTKDKTHIITAVFGEEVRKTASVTITIWEKTFSYLDITGVVGQSIISDDFGPVWVGVSVPGDLRYSVEPALPAGLTLDVETGKISGIPRAFGSGTYEITASYGEDKKKKTLVAIEVESKDSTSGAPTIDSVEPGDGRAKVIWTAPQDGQAEQIWGYRVYWQRDAEPTKLSSSTLIADPEATTKDITGLINGGTYHFAVAAISQVIESDLSESVEAPACRPGQIAKPSVIPAYGGDERITVSWLPPQPQTVGPMEALAGYKIYYKTKDAVVESVEDVDPSKTSFDFLGLAYGAYSFRITAVYGEGEETDFRNPKSLTIRKIHRR